MIDTCKSPNRKKIDTAMNRLLVAAHLQVLEDNPLDAEDFAMFEMFEREGWPDDKRRVYIRECALVDRIASEKK